MSKQLDKHKLVEAIRDHLEKDLEALKAAALATYEAATNEESKPENEYDTRGLEASYLAGAQAKRVGEIEEFLTVLKPMEIKSFGPDDPIGSTALVAVELSGKRSFVFVLGKGGGLTLPFEGQSIQVVTPSSPLGEALLGLKEGDDAVVEVGDQVKEYEILSVQ